MNEGHYKPWAVGRVSGVNMFDLLRLGVPEILYSHAATQSYHKKGNIALNFSVGNGGGLGKELQV